MVSTAFHPKMLTTSTDSCLTTKRVRTSKSTFSQIQSGKKKQRRTATPDNNEAKEEPRDDDTEKDSYDEEASSSTEQWSPCVTQQECIGTLSYIAGGVYANNSLLLITGVIDDETYECVLLKRSDTSNGMINTQQIFSLPVHKYKSVEDKIETDDDDDDYDHDDHNTISRMALDCTRPSAQLSLRST